MCWNLRIHVEIFKKHVYIYINYINKYFGMGAVFPYTCFISWGLNAIETSQTYTNMMAHPSTQKAAVPSSIAIMVQDQTCAKASVDGWKSPAPNQQLPRSGCGPQFGPVLALVNGRVQLVLSTNKHTHTRSRMPETQPTKNVFRTRNKQWACCSYQLHMRARCDRQNFITSR